MKRTALVLMVIGVLVAIVVGRTLRLTLADERNYCDVDDDGVNDICDLPNGPQGVDVQYLDLADLDQSGEAFCDEYLAEAPDAECWVDGSRVYFKAP